MRRLLPAAILLALALAAPAAHAGGWASATISSSPAGTAPGEPWRAELTILQHGRTPMTGLRPAVLVTRPDGSERRFDARSTDKPGIYVADVVFPQPGRYRYTVDDGFTNAIPHEFPPVDIGAAAADTAGAAAVDPGEAGVAWWPFAIAAGALALIAAIAALPSRRRGARPPVPRRS